MDSRQFLVTLDVENMEDHEIVTALMDTHLVPDLFYNNGGTAIVTAVTPVAKGDVT